MSAIVAAAVALARPSMEEWADSASAALATLPRSPQDAGVRIDGPDPLRLLLIGSGVVAGRDPVTHESTLARAIAQALHQRTGRGVEVDATIDPVITIACLEPILGRESLSSYDGVITCVGDIDALRAVRPSDWRRRVAASVAVWCRRVRESRVMIMVGVGATGGEPGVGGLHGWLADGLARQLNAITDELTASVPTVRTTLLPQLADADPRGASGSHELWGAQLAADLVDHWRAIGRPGVEPAAVTEPWQRVGLADAG
ncbi:MAG: hypothetical protein ACO1N6_02495 [Microcella sp.]